MGKLIQLSDYRDFNRIEYVNYLQVLSIPELMQEMTSFDDVVQEKGYTKPLREQGIVLYTRVMNVCKTDELRGAAKEMLGFLNE